MEEPDDADYSTCCLPLNPVGLQKIAHLSLKGASTATGLEDAKAASPI